MSAATAPNDRFIRRVLVASALLFSLGLSPPPAMALPGEVQGEQKISSTTGGLVGPLANGDQFGISAEGIGDRGAVWVLFLNVDGTVKSHQKISDTQGEFTGMLDDEDRFGASTASLGDLDGDGIGDVAFGALFDDDGGGAFGDHGAAWILFLNADGTVKSHQKISETHGGFTGTLDSGDRFGASAVSLGDLDGDGIRELAVGAQNDSDGGSNRGAVWILSLDSAVLSAVTR